MFKQIIRTAIALLIAAGAIAASPALAADDGLVRVKAMLNKSTKAEVARYELLV